MGHDRGRTFIFNLIEQFEWVASFAVHLVHEDYDRSLAHTAHFHQLACLGFYAFGTIDHNDDAIDGSQCAVGVFGEVLVAGGVEDIDFVAVVVKFHDRCRD